MQLLATVIKITAVAVKSPHALTFPARAAASYVPVDLDTLGMDTNASVSRITEYNFFLNHNETSANKVSIVLWEE